MPFGLIPHTRRIGISNTTTYNASLFATIVLRMPTDIPIYQQQLVHSNEWRHGPERAAAEWCLNGANDGDWQHTYTLRQISAHDTFFSRRNVEGTPNFSLQWHRANTDYQIYYVNNEPEAGSSLRLNFAQCATDANDQDCWNPRDRYLDPSLKKPDNSPVFPPDPLNPQIIPLFWEDGISVLQGCSNNQYPKRIQAKALAYVYLRFKRETETLPGKHHVVLPPAAIHADFEPANPYWPTFFDNIHNVSGVTINGSTEAGITPSGLKVLHIHHYSPKKYATTPATPLDSVIETAKQVRSGADWYRSRYNGGNPLLLDILISEIGPDWRDKTTPTGKPKAIAGGWDNFRDGLSWWNSLLRWYTKRAGKDCNLQGWDVGTHTVYGLIHEPVQVPFVELSPKSTAASGPLTTRQQWFFNADAWATYIDYAIPALTYPALGTDVGAQYYQNTVSSSNPISWGVRHNDPAGALPRTWYTTPFGACTAVWAQVGADPTTTTIGTGWVPSTTAGTIGGTGVGAIVTLPVGYSTVYFPVFKDYATFTSMDQISFAWIRGNGDVCYRGYMALSDFQDTKLYTYVPPGSTTGVTEPMYSAMIFPVVCYSSILRQVTVELRRPYNGPQVWVGRPIVLPGACSWLNTQ